MKQGKMSSPKSAYSTDLSVSNAELTGYRKTTKNVTGFPGKPALPTSLKENFDKYQETHTIIRKDREVKL